MTLYGTATDHPSHSPMCVYMCSQVVVSVGTSLHYTPGSITFVTSTMSQFPVAAVAGGVVGGGVGLIVFIVAIILVACRRKSVIRSQVDVQMMPTLGEDRTCCARCVYAQVCVSTCVHMYVLTRVCM